MRTTKHGKRIVAFFLTAVMVMGIIAPATVHAATYAVTDEPSLISALAGASAGDTIELQTDITITAALSVTKNVTITSSAGNNFTITMATPNVRHMAVSTTVTVALTLENVTLDGATIGGGIEAGNDFTLTMIGATVQNCLNIDSVTGTGSSALNMYGGAIYAGTTSAINITNSALVNNKVSASSSQTVGAGARAYGGAIYVKANSTINITDSVLTGNEAYAYAISSDNNSTAYAYGGAIYTANNCTINLYGTAKIEENEALSEAITNRATTTASATTNSYGGGVYMDTNGKVNMSGTTSISSNKANAYALIDTLGVTTLRLGQPKAQAYGGGFYISGTDSETSGAVVNLFENAAVRDNINFASSLRSNDLTAYSTNTDVSGGGIYLGNGTSADANGTINLKDSSSVSKNNISEDHIGGGNHYDFGGGVYTGAFNVITVDDESVIDGNIAGESTSDRGNGGGIYAESNCVVGVYTGFITNNVSNGSAGGIYAGSGSEVNIFDGKITGNKAITPSNTNINGGGIMVTGTGTVLNIFDGLISENYAGTVGGGVYGSASSIINITGGLITENISNSQGGGAGVNASTINISDDAKITYNTARLHGGGVHTAAPGTINISGGIITENKAGDGGGVSCSDGTMYGVGTINISGTAEIIKNAADKNGGGVYAPKGGTVTMTGGTISENMAINGGGFYGSGLSSRPGTLTMSGGTITKNAASTSGGGVYIYTYATFHMSDGIISGNAASTTGGGVYVSSNVQFNMSGGTIKKNTAATNGGGIYAESTAKVAMTGGTIAKNTATNGGGIYGSTIMTIADSVISGNKANEGGGIYLATRSAASRGSLTVSGGEFTHNEAANIGGGIVAFNYNAVEITDGTLFEENVAGTDGGAIHIYALENLKVGTAAEDPKTVVFNRNHAQDGYLISDAHRALHATNIFAASFTFPFKYAYNNFDVNYKSWIVVFNSNGGSCVPTAVVEDSKAVAKPENPTKTGYTFENWYVKEDLTGNVWKFLGENNPNLVKENTTLHAKWTPKKWKLIFIYNDNGESTGGASEKPVTYDAKVGDLPAPTRPGYVFGGWYTIVHGNEIEYGGGVQYTAETIYQVDGDTKLYARWTLIPATITAKGFLGATELYSYKIESNKSVTYHPVPVWDNFPTIKVTGATVQITPSGTPQTAAIADREVIVNPSSGNQTVVFNYEKNVTDVLVYLLEYPGGTNIVTPITFKDVEKDKPFTYLPPAIAGYELVNGDGDAVSPYEGVISSVSDAVRVITFLYRKPSADARITVIHRDKYNLDVLAYTYENISPNAPKNIPQTAIPNYTFDDTEVSRTWDGTAGSDALKDVEYLYARDEKPLTLIAYDSASDSVIDVTTTVTSSPQRVLESYTYTSELSALDFSVSVFAPGKYMRTHAETARIISTADGGNTVIVYYCPKADLSIPVEVRVGSASGPMLYSYSVPALEDETITLSGSLIPTIAGYTFAESLSTLTATQGDAVNGTIIIVVADSRYTVTVNTKLGSAAAGLFETRKYIPGAEDTIYAPFMDGWVLDSYQVDGGSEVDARLLSSAGVAFTGANSITANHTITFIYKTVDEASDENHVIITVVGKENDTDGTALYSHVKRVDKSDVVSQVISDGDVFGLGPAWSLIAGQDGKKTFAPDGVRTVEFYYESNARTVTVKAVDESNNPIAADQTFTVTAGTALIINAPTVADYELVSAADAVKTHTVSVSKDLAANTLVFTYKKMQGNVQFRFVDDANRDVILLQLSKSEAVGTATAGLTPPAYTLPSGWLLKDGTGSPAASETTVSNGTVITYLLVKDMRDITVNYYEAGTTNPVAASTVTRAQMGAVDVIVIAEPTDLTANYVIDGLPYEIIPSVNENKTVNFYYRDNSAQTVGTVTILCFDDNGAAAGNIIFYSVGAPIAVGDPYTATAPFLTGWGNPTLASGSDPATGTMTNPGVTVIYEYDSETVTIPVIVTDTDGNPLDGVNYISGTHYANETVTAGSDVRIHAPHFDGYVVVGVSFTDFLSADGSETAEFIYRKESGATNPETAVLTVQGIDASTQKVIYTLSVTAVIGYTESAVAPTIPYYNLAANSARTQSTTIAAGENKIVFNYNPAKIPTTPAPPIYIEKVEQVVVEVPVEVVREVPIVSETVVITAGRPSETVARLLETEEHIKYLNGYEDGTVRPDNTITRAEVASIFFRLIRDENKNVPVSGTFTDVDGAKWYAQAVNYLASKGILNGYEDGSFMPDKSVTRAEFAAIASRFDETKEGIANVFVDLAETHWAYKYVMSAYMKGWISGYPGGEFKPENSITRAEVVSIVNRVLGRKLNKDDIDARYRTMYTDLNETHWAFAGIIEASAEHDYEWKEDGYENWLN